MPKLQFFSLRFILVCLFFKVSTSFFSPSFGAIHLRLGWCCITHTFISVHRACRMFASVSISRLLLNNNNIIVTYEVSKFILWPESFAFIPGSYSTFHSVI